MSVYGILTVKICEKKNKQFNFFKYEVYFKGARAQKIGLKVLILKYHLGKSLSKEMWCKMADTKTNFDYIF